MPPKTQFAQLGDVRIAYRDEGNPDGPALVLAHAMDLDLTLWDAVIPHLPTSLRIIRFDLRGHGQSSRPPAPYSMGALVRDAETLLDYLNIRDCVFAGLSIGGMVAQGLAVKRLDQVRALVLSNTVTKIGTKETWAKMMDDVRQFGLAPRLETDLEQSFTAAFRTSPAITRWRQKFAGREVETFLGSCAAIAGTDYYTTTASLRLPSLVIATSEDAITPADMVRELADLIPGAQFRLIRKSGHLPPIEQPKTFANTLTEFLQAIGHV